jgi:TPP-dependent pyruvate/acetoin dehydrogenase alpha subunit
MTLETAQPTAEVSGAVAHLEIQDRILLLRAMVMMRGLEERAMSLYRQGKVPGSLATVKRHLEG